MTKSNYRGVDDDDQVAVAASRALEQISSLAHARSQSSTPSGFPKRDDQNHQAQDSKQTKSHDILDIFMSPDKPKSKLRLLAENSAKKYSRSSFPVQTLNNSKDSNDLAPEDFVLNLGTPNKPLVDPKTLSTYKPPSRRSLGPRRSSLASKKSLSHSKSPKPTIENLLNHLDILDGSQSTNPSDSDQKQPIKSNMNKKPLDKKPAQLPTRRKARRVTIVHVPADEDNADSNNIKLSETSNPLCSRIEIHESGTCDKSDSDSDHSLGENSNLSSDSFDLNTLIAPKNQAEKEKEDEKEPEDSIIINPPRSSARQKVKSKPKRIISDSESESERDDQKIFSKTPSGVQASQSTTNLSSSRRSQRKTSLRANHSQLKSFNSVMADDTLSDDSIEIIPARAHEFQKMRSKALSVVNTNSQDYEPSVKSNSDDEAFNVPKVKQLSTRELSSSKVKAEESVPRNRAKSMIAPPDQLVKEIDENLNQRPRRGSNPQPTRTCNQSKSKKPVPFSEQKRELIEELINKLDNLVFGNRLPTELQLVWSKRLNTTAGRAKLSVIRDPLSGKVTKEKIQIELGTKIIDTEQKLKNTLAHELCHVACWSIDGKKKENHGKYFQAWVHKIHQAMPDIHVTTRHSYEINYKFKWRCSRPGCEIVYGRHSNSINPERQVCRCGGRLVALPRPGSRGRAVITARRPSTSQSKEEEAETSDKKDVELDLVGPLIDLSDDSVQVDDGSDEPLIDLSSDRIPMSDQLINSLIGLSFQH